MVVFLEEGESVTLFIALTNWMCSSFTSQVEEQEGTGVASDSLPDKGLHTNTLSRLMVLCVCRWGAVRVGGCEWRNRMVSTQCALVLHYVVQQSYLPQPVFSCYRSDNNMKPCICLSHTISNLYTYCLGQV